MVKEILTQCDMPLHLIFGGSRFKAVAVLAHEMENADYAKDRINAADKLLTHVKPPETLGDSLAGRYECCWSNYAANAREAISRIS